MTATPDLFAWSAARHCGFDRLAPFSGFDFTCPCGAEWRAWSSQARWPRPGQERGFYAPEALTRGRWAFRLPAAKRAAE